MDRYQRVEKPRVETPIDENEIRITSQGRMHNYITYPMTLLQEKESDEIVFKAMGRAIDETVTIMELIKVCDISLTDYIGVVPAKHATYVPHTAGRYSVKRFRKAQCPIVERLTNSLMMHGQNNGKKLMAVRIIRHAMEIIHLLTDQNPIQIIVDAVVNSGPREYATRIGSAGVRRQAVDISPLRRVNQTIYLLTTGARESAFMACQV